MGESWNANAKALIRNAEKCKSFDGINSSAILSIAASLIAITELLEAKN